LLVAARVAEKMEPPVFVVKPVNKDVKEEGKATFECKLKGKPLPEVTWSVTIHLQFLLYWFITCKRCDVAR